MAYNFKIVYVVISFGVSLFIIYAGWVGLLKPEIDKSELWFQRTGSIVVFLSLLADFFINNEKNKLNRSIHKDNLAVQISKKYLPIFKILHFCSIVMAILGTLIWGYGDLFFKHFT